MSRAKVKYFILSLCVFHSRASKQFFSLWCDVNHFILTLLSDFRWVKGTYQQICLCVYYENGKNAIFTMPRWNTLYQNNLVAVAILLNKSRNKYLNVLNTVKSVELKHLPHESNSVRCMLSWWIASNISYAFDYSIEVIFTLSIQSPFRFPFLDSIFFYGKAHCVLMWKLGQKKICCSQFNLMLCVYKKFSIQM